MLGFPISDVADSKPWGGYRRPSGVRRPVWSPSDRGELDRGRHAASERTIRRQSGSFRGAIQRAGLSLDW